MLGEIPGKGGNPDKPKLNLFVPSLEVPYEGAFIDVSTDYEKDPKAFLTSLEYRMKEENPALLKIMKIAQVFYDSEDYGLKWLALYYEILARSSRRIGMPPLQVTDEVFDSYHKTEVLIGLNLLKSTDGREKMAQRLEVGATERRKRDEDFSPELRLFWESVNKSINDLKTEGGHEPEVSWQLFGVRNMQVLIQRQQDAYRLTGIDIHGLL